MKRSTILAIIGAAAFIVAYAVAVDAAAATGSESVGVKHAAAHVRTARAALADAERVLTATKRYQAAYGSGVARWAWLVDSVGWKPATWPWLFMVIDRESGGSPKALNAASGCAGLLQILPSNVTQPGRLTQPRYNLAQGLRLYRLCGQDPWAL